MECSPAYDPRKSRDWLLAERGRRGAVTPMVFIDTLHDAKALADGLRSRGVDVAVFPVDGGHAGHGSVT
jgi:hypothetical protein